jgi:hypothetical protein
MIKRLLIATAALGLLAAASVAHAGSLLMNGDFEAGNIGATNYTYPGGDYYSWTYGGSALVNAQAGNAWYGGAAPAGFGGDQFAALQSTSTLSQSFFTPGGTLDLTWLAGGRPNFGAYAGDQSYAIEIDGHVVGGYSTVSDQSFTSESLLLTGLSTGVHTLTFQGLSGSDETAFLDNVSVAGVPEPATWAMMILGLGGLGVVLRRRPAALLA